MASCNCGRRPIDMPYAGRIHPVGGYRADTSNPASMFRAVTPGTDPTCHNEIECRGPLAMAYVPWQTWKETYPMDRALVRGTIFPELDQPFVMGRCR